ncbi:MAG: APC family permease [Acidimicrobiia bacterium]
MSELGGPRGPYHPRVESRRARGRLGLWDTTAMAVGGMIGGGIFSVLGVAVALAGHLAFGCFVFGAVLAAITARSYARLAARTRSSGGPFIILRERGETGLAGTLLWLLVFGYMIVMGVYSFTFGRYAANALGVSHTGARLLSIGIVVAFLVVNLLGVRVSARTEDAVVATKIAILATVAVVGIAEFTPDRMSPLANKGVAGLFVGAAMVFVAYEGFELIAYDWDDLADPDRTLPRALYLSVAIVAAVYTSVTVAAQLLVADHTIAAQKEVAFVAVGEAALGPIGRWVAIVGALLATGSAINATLFSTARLVRDASRSGELPRFLSHERGGLPLAALALISGAGAAFAMLPGITAVLAFGSAAFLAIYAVVNLIVARIEVRRRDQVLAAGASMVCIVSIVVLGIQLAREEPGSLAIAVVITIALLFARFAYRRRERSTPK